MDVLMIHGLGQQDFTINELRRTWENCIDQARPGFLKGKSIEMAYYGTTLAEWTKGSSKKSVAMGNESTAIAVEDADELKFMSAALEEIVADHGISEADINAVNDAEVNAAVPMDNFVARRLVGLVRIMENISPLKGALILRLIKQGHTYMTSPKAAKAVDDIVRPLIHAGPKVLLTHSLGTVIAFKLLREMESNHPKITIPLFITMGSPLSLQVFKAKLGPPRNKPSFVGQWQNFYDPSDFVTLGKPLNDLNFASNISNDGTVDNRTDNAHGIIGYLPHKGVIKALETVI